MLISGSCLHTPDDQAKKAKQKIKEDKVGGQIPEKQTNYEDFQQSVILEEQ